MKKLIFILLISVFLISFVYAEDCQLATPRYGVVQCDDTGQKETLSSNFGNFDGEWSTVGINCLSNCKIDFFPDSCPKMDWIELKAFKNGDERDLENLEWARGDELIIKGRCKTLLFQIKEISSDEKVEYIEDEIKLKEEWAGSMPENFIDGTEGCVVNKQYEFINLNSYLDPITDSTENFPDPTYSNLNDYPFNWKIGDKFIFVKDWQTGIADISLTYDKENKGYWCGGQYGSRKIYDVKEITSSTGSCYAIPQSIFLPNIECCFPSDCVNSFGAEYTCNPDNWKCEKTKPCNSQLDCDSVFGEGICQDNQINQWVCDLNKKWGDYAGTCIHSSKQVSECPSDCNKKEYYNEEQGKCLPRIGLEIESENSSSITGGAIGASKGSSTGTTILVIFLILIGGSIAYFVYVKNKKGKLKDKVKKEIDEKGKHCKKCGSLLRPNSVFCTKCGKRN